jgi:hypothetical protein
VIYCRSNEGFAFTDAIPEGVIALVENETEKTRGFV